MKKSQELVQELLLSLSKEPAPQDIVARLRALEACCEEESQTLEALREANHRLRAARSHYSSLYENAPVPYFVFDPKGVVISINQAAAKMLELPNTHHSFSFSSYLHSTSRKQFESHLHTIYSRHQRHRVELMLYPESQLDGRTEAGPLQAGPLQAGPREAIHVALDSAWSKHPDHPSGYCLSSCIDISSFKRLQNELEEARIQAEKASSLKSQFLANMSHEIRTPLSSVLGYVDLLRQDIQEPEQRERLEIVYRAGKHLLFLLNELIDLSRIEHGRLEVYQSPFLPSALFDGLQDLFEIAAEEGNIDLQFEREFVPEPLLGDAERLRQILVNIIGNAVKFTPPGGQIRVKVMYSLETLIVEVRDTGPGIPEDQIEAIFEMFHQADNSDTRIHGGSGLGLAIAQKLAESMKGSIELQSAVGVGSTFCIRIPAAIASDDDELSEVSGVLPTPFFSEESAEIPRILIVDDDRVLQRLLGIFVERMGYEFDIAVHGRDALVQLEQRRYDLVLLDLQMPVMDGYQTARNIRSRETLKELPVIALTAKAIQEDLNKCLTAGCDSYITKPVVYKKLAQQVHRFLKPMEEEAAG